MEETIDGVRGRTVWNWVGAIAIYLIVGAAVYGLEHFRLRWLPAGDELEPLRFLMSVATMTVALVLGLFSFVDVPKRQKHWIAGTSLAILLLPYGTAVIISWAPDGVHPFIALLVVLTVLVAGACVAALIALARGARRDRGPDR